MWSYFFGRNIFDGILYLNDCIKGGFELDQYMVAHVSFLIDFNIIDPIQKCYCIIE